MPLRVRLAAVLSALALACAGGALLPTAVGYDAAVAASCQTQHNSVHVQLSASRYPETTDHIADAIAAGQPSLLHIDRADEDAHRAASLADYPPRAGSTGMSSRLPFREKAGPAPTCATSTPLTTEEPARAWATSSKVGARASPSASTSPDSIDGERMLSITTKSPYALRALAELGRSGEGPVPIGELARRREIPVQFLEQLFAALRRAGVLRSQRGVKGGYSFARPPHEVTVLEIVELLDGPLGREAQGIFADAATAARDVFAAATIADIVEREAREAGAAMYYI